MVSETTPLNGRQAGGGGFLTCRKAFGCAEINVGMMIVLGIDVLAFIVLLVSFCLTQQSIGGYTTPAYGAALAMANSIFFLVGGICLACAVFIPNRQVSNICVLAGLFFHILLILLLFIGWIWQAVNWADADCSDLAGFGALSTLADKCSTYKFGQAWGMWCSLILWILSPHLCQIINTWRVNIVGKSGMKDAFNNASAVADQPKQSSNNLDPKQNSQGSKQASKASIKSNKSGAGASPADIANQV